MRLFRCLFVLIALFLTQSSFADVTGAMATASTDNKACESIAAACTSAGFSRTDTASKRFWQDCMKPVILGQSVTGVTVDTATVQACRTAKIEDLQNELNDLQKATMPKTN